MTRAELEPSVAPEPRDRVCGPCTACCAVIGVHELGKELYEPCPHLGEAGCGIFGRPDRPASCGAFACQWLRGLLEVDGEVDLTLRPDACGVVFDYQPASVFGEMFVAWEVEPGASARAPAREIVEGLQERFLVMIVSRGAEGADEVAERRFVGPPDSVAGAAGAEVTWGA